MHERTANRPGDAKRRRRAAMVLVPWLVYVGVTLAAPAANGAWRSAGFAEHAGITLVVSGAMAGAWFAWARWRSASRGASRTGE